MKNRWYTWGRAITLTASSAALLTHAYLGTYSRFMADDYCSASTAARLGILRAAWYWYITWTGRYSANLLDSLFGILGPKVTPFVTSFALISWLAAVTMTASILLPVREKKDRLLISVTIASSILFLTLTLTPNVRQSLYWGQGMRSVVPPLIIGTMYTCVLWFRSRTPFDKSQILWLALSFIMAYVAGGFSETYTVFQLSAFFLVLCLLRATKRRDTESYFLFAGTAGAILSLITVLGAPGNPERQAYFPAPSDPLSVFVIAIKSFAIFGARMANSTDKILGLIGAIAVGASVGSQIESKPVKPWTPALILILGIGLVFSCFPPSAYGMSDAPPDRTLIIAAYALVITLLLFGFVCGQMLTHKAQDASRKTGINFVAGLTAMLMLTASAIAINNMVSSRRVFERYASAWDKMHAQMLAYKVAGKESVVISTAEMDNNNWAELNVLGDNPKFWVNECFSNYYGVKVIANDIVPSTAP